MRNRIPICISSVYVKEADFKYLRSIAKDIIDKHPFFEGIRNPEDVKTQGQFDHYIGKSFALVLILGKTPSRAVAKELYIAIKMGIPVIPLIKTDVIAKRIKVSNATKKLLEQADWNFDDIKIYFNNPDDFRTILSQTLNYSIIHKLELSASIYQNRVDVYDSIADSLEKCRRLCILAQKTPTIFLGAKVGDPRDQKLYKATINMLHRIEDGKLKGLLIIFNYNKTVDALKNKSEYPNIGQIKRRILPLLYSIRKKIHIRATDEMLFPFLLSDHNFIYKLNIGTSNRYMILPSVILPMEQRKELEGYCETIGNNISIDQVQEMYK